MTDDFAGPDAAAQSLAAAMQSLGPTAGRAFADISAGVGRSAREIEKLSEGLKDVAGVFKGAFRTAFSSAFDDLFRKGAKASDVLRSLALDISKIVLKRAVGAVTDKVAGSLSDWLGGALGGALGFAQGGVIDAGRVRAFAQGGVVDGPTFFPMARGAGLMGEAGPEAILPLRRGADGALGVASGSSGGGAPVIVNIHTPDAESFRRSRSQVASALARAVDRGRRNL